MVNLELSKVNYEIYSEEEYQEIQQSILDTTGRIQEIDATINTLQVAIDAERKRRQALLRDFGLYRAAVAPHKRLPEDILRIIFAFCARAYGTVQIPLWYNRCTPTQLFLSHVCSKWRQTALGTSELWSDIYIDEAPLKQIPSHVCQVWLERAANSLLAIKVDVFDHLLDLTAFQKLLSRPARIAYLDLMIYDIEIDELSALPENLLPDVREVRLSMEIDGDAPIPSQLPSFYISSFKMILPSISAPQLTKLSLTRKGQEKLDRELEELELFKLDGSFSLDTILKNAPSLRRITFPDSPRGDMAKDIMYGLATGRLGSCLESIEVPYVDDAGGIFEIFDMVELRQKNSKGQFCDSQYNKIAPFKS
ncbi:hypothetical protein AX17_004037 [Amanita inopinata Kibby_2008]|nr:hypothetical protein AX17_004037 [Amanita inopinata Kibby_2008]